MTTRVVLSIGGAVGLAVSCIVLALLWYGFSGLLVIGHTNLRHLLWPSFIMLTNGWRSTPAGILITVSSVAINCLVYMAVVYSLWRVLRLITPR